MRYQIANMIFEFCGNAPLADSPKWSLFRTNETRPADYVFCRRFVDMLPEIPDGRYYYDEMHKRYYTVTYERENTMFLDVLQDARPWGEQIHNLYTELAMPHVLLHGQKLLLHASYIETPQGAIVFTAPSGTGKSTQAELWKTHRGASILNGDRAVIGMEEVPTVYGYPLSGSSDDCVNRSLPLRALVFLEQAPENAARRLHGRELLRVLLNGTYHDPKYPNDFSRNLDAALRLSSAPVFHLACRPDPGAVEALENALSEPTNGGKL